MQTVSERSLENQRSYLKLRLLSPDPHVKEIVRRMATSRSNPETEAYLHRFFKLLSDTPAKKHFFRCLEHNSDDSPDILSLLVLFLRDQNLSSPFLEFIVEESLSSIKSPNEMFRIDHIFTRILREFVHQTLETSLTNWLEPILSSLDQDLIHSDIGTCATHLFKRLYQFRFPTETKSFFITLVSLINHRFPDQFRVGLSGIFFLRYLCPLILSSPTSFALLDTPRYQQNALQLVKIIHNIANGTVPPNSSPDMLLIHM